MDVSIVSPNSGDYVEIWVHAIFGRTILTSDNIVYQPNSPATATFTCNGTTLIFSCDLDGVSYAEQVEEVNLALPEAEFLQ